MNTHATFNPMHLGDNLVHLHFLRALAKAHPDHHFTHGAPDQHLAQLYPLWQDLPNLRVCSLGEIPTGALNTWRGDLGHWYHHPRRNDFAAYHLEFFAYLAERMGLLSPFKTPADILFDYPALMHRVPGGCDLPYNIDFLIINSAPQSGQWSGFNYRDFDDIAISLHERGRSVITTFPCERSSIPCTTDTGLKLDVTGIGKLSQQARCIIGCVTGPMWPTLNIWNAAKPLRIHLLDTERVELCGNTIHANSLTLVPEILKDRGLL